MKKNSLAARFFDYLVISVLLLSFVRIDYLYEKLQMTKILGNISMGGLALVIIFVIGTSIIKKNLPFDLLCIILFFGYLFLATILFRSRNIELFFRTYASPLGLCLLAWYCFVNGKIKIFLNAFIIFEVMIYLNFLTTLIYPSGMYTSLLYSANWLLGYKNPQIRLMIPVLGISVIRGFEKDSKISLSSFVLFFVSLLTMLRVNSTTGILGIFLFGILVFVFFLLKNTRPKWLTLLNISIVFLIINIGIIFLNIQTWFTSFLESFGKNAELSGRTRIWDASVAEIPKKLVFGHGFIYSSEYIAMFHMPAGAHPHNYLLYILMQGGLVLFGILAIWLVFCSRRLQQYECISGTVILLVLITLFFIGLNESLTGNNFLYMFLVMGTRVNDFSPETAMERRLHNWKLRVKV